MKCEHQLRVEEFMRKAQQCVFDTPGAPDEKTRVLRATLVLEECLELIKAMGIEVSHKGNHVPLEISDIQYKIVDDPNITEVADACADISVVNVGTAASFGISLAPILVEVDNNNLDKFRNGGYIREDGKLVKPKDHPKPNILGELLKQGLLIKQ